MDEAPEERAAVSGLLRLCFLLGHQQPDGSWLLSGLVHVESLEELFGVELEIVDRDFDTVGGLVVSVLGRVPVAGEEFLHGPLRVRVVEADARRVFQVEVARAESTDGGPEDTAVSS